MNKLVELNKALACFVVVFGLSYTARPVDPIITTSVTFRFIFSTPLHNNV